MGYIFDILGSGRRTRQPIARPGADIEYPLKITLEEAVDVFKFYDREKWIKIIVEPQR